MNVSRETIQEFDPETVRVLPRMGWHIDGIAWHYRMQLREQIRRLWRGPQVYCIHCDQQVIYGSDGYTFVHWYNHVHCNSYETDDSTGNSVATPDVSRETIEHGRYDMH